MNHSDTTARAVVRGLSAVLAAERRTLTKAQRLDVDRALGALREPLEERTMPKNPSGTSDTLTRLLETRDATLGRGEAILEAAADDLTDAEVRALTDIKAQAERLNDKIEDLRTMETETSNAAEYRKPHEAILARGEIRGGHEHVYRPDGTGPSFFMDIVAAGRGDADAADRLRRNERFAETRNGSESRAGTSGSATSFGSFIPPVWVLDQLANFARPGRVIPELVQHGGPPTSTSMTVPRVTTGTVAAIQATENTTVGTTDVITAQLTRTTSTIGGYQDVSVQSIELTPMAVDRFIFADLTADYERALDSQCIIGTGANNQLLGLDNVASVNGITYTQASPTVPLLYSQIANAIQTVATTRYQPADAIVMHPRRWSYFLAASDTTGRPLVTPDGGTGFNSTATEAPGVQAYGRVGMLQGLPVYTDANIPTNLGAGTYDEIYVAKFGDMVLYESDPRVEQFRDIGSANLTVRFRIYAFANFFAGRFPGGISRITGSGLIAPTW